MDSNGNASKALSRESASISVEMISGILLKTSPQISIRNCSDEHARAFFQDFYRKYPKHFYWELLWDVLQGFLQAIFINSTRNSYRRSMKDSSRNYFLTRWRFLKRISRKIYSSFQATRVPLNGLVIFSFKNSYMNPTRISPRYSFRNYSKNF